MGWVLIFNSEEQEDEEIVVENSEEIICKLLAILISVSDSLNRKPEQGILIALDTSILASSVSLSLVGRLRTCMSVELAIEDLLDIQRLLNANISNSAYANWPSEVALCSVSMPETYDQCQPPLPWPYYWVQDNYLETEPFFGMKDEAEKFIDEYVERINFSEESMEVTIDIEMNYMTILMETLNVLQHSLCESPKIYL